jgi:hypothetical protein
MKFLSTHVKLCALLLLFFMVYSDRLRHPPNRQREEMTMRMFLSAASVAALLALSAAAQAAPQSCEQRAGNCSARGGHSCFDPSIMASCHATGVYVAPSGRRWQAVKTTGK